MQYFTKYSFIPSPDGGIYDMGFGVLLGPLNESTDSIVNQLIDAGTMQNTKGGFLGRGAKIRGGVYTFAPLEWKRVDSSGDDLRKNIVPLEVGEPSLVLFQLLSLLINYVQRISGTTDPLVGEPTGQNTPAETTRAMIQEGMKIYSAIFKRVWRSMKEEFKKGYVLNGIYMPRRKSFGSGQLALREDYLGNPNEVVPSADPNVASEQMQLVQAQMLKQAAMSTPGYDPDAVERRYLKALKIDAIDQIYPGVAKTGMPKDVKLQIAELKLQGEQTRLQSEQQQFLIEMMEEQRVNNANIAKIAAEIQNMTAVTEGDKDDRKIALLNAMLGMMKLRNETLTKAIDVKIKELELKRAKVDANAGDVSGLGGASGNGGAKKRSATVSQMAAA
jgi:chaperonin GroES